MDCAACGRPMTRVDGRYWVCFHCRGPNGAARCRCGARLEHTPGGDGMVCPDGCETTAQTI